MIRKAIIIMLTLAAVESAGLWGCGYWLGLPARHSYIIDRNLGGKTYILVITLDADAVYSLSGMWRHDQPSRRRVRGTRIDVAGFHYTNVALVDSPMGLQELTRVGAPLWALTVIFASYPAVAFIRGRPLRRRRRRLRLRKGLCLECGYNLTGNESGVCPECGTKIEPADDAAG